MHLFRSEMVGDAHHVGGEVLIELQRAFIVLGIAVAPRVPGGGPEVGREEFDLPRPVAPAAADAVQEEEESAFAGDRYGQARDRPDTNGSQGYSAFAPEIFTARPRLSLSFRM